MAKGSKEVKMSDKVFVANLAWWCILATATGFGIYFTLYAFPIWQASMVGATINVLSMFVIVSALLVQTTKISEAADDVEKE